MTQLRCLILGAGSQAKVVIDLLRASGEAQPIGCLEIGKDVSRVGESLLGVPILGQVAELKQIAETHEVTWAIAAIGDNHLRLQLLDQAESAGLALLSLQHPSAIVASEASIGVGCIISAFAFVGVEATLGRGVIINTAAGVDHDCVVGDGVHVAVGARCAGNVSIGSCATLGAGCTVIPGVTIGTNAVVGAGAAVVRDIAEGSTVVGVPARLHSK